MNTERIDALCRLIKRQPDLTLKLAGDLHANGYLTDEQYEALKRERERMEAGA